MNLPISKSTSNLFQISILCNWALSPPQLSNNNNSSKAIGKKRFEIKINDNKNTSLAVWIKIWNLANFLFAFDIENAY